MMLGSLPFILDVQMRHVSWQALFGDRQVRAFLWIAGIATAFLWVMLVIDLGFGIEHGARSAAFNAISVLTGTGYATTTFDDWGPFAFTLFFVLMFIGGCAGSTSCGIKVFRFQVLYAVADVQLRRLIQPHAVYVPIYNQQPITADISLSVLSFFSFYFLIFAPFPIKSEDPLVGIEFVCSF